MRTLLSIFAIFWLPTTALARNNNAIHSSEHQSFLGNTLDFLAGASWDFMVATITIAFLAAVVLEAARDFGLRSIINLLYLRRWPFTPLVFRQRLLLWRNQTVLALAPDELCGHIASSIRSRLFNLDETDALGSVSSSFRSQSSLDAGIEAERELLHTLELLSDISIREIGDPDSDSDERHRDEALAQLIEIIDRSIDVLQLRLRTANRWLGLTLSVAIAFFISTILVTGFELQTSTIPLLVMVAASGGLISPLLRGLVRKVTSDS